MKVLGTAKYNPTCIPHFQMFLQFSKCFFRFHKNFACVIVLNGSHLDNVLNGSSCLEFVSVAVPVFNNCVAFYYLFDICHDYGILG